MMNFIDPPKKIPGILEMLIRIAERHVGKPLRAIRIMAWYPKAVVSSAVIEGMITADDKEVDKRLLNMIRLYTSIMVSCPFCMDMNARDLEKNRITEDELRYLQGMKEYGDVGTISEKEKAALDYVSCMCRTPVAISEAVSENIKSHFSERGIVIISSTCAQVNYWARMIKSLGVEAAGFSNQCAVLNLDDDMFK